MNHAASSARALLSLSLLAALAATGCGADDVDDVDGTIADNYLSFEEFKSSLPRDPESGAYLVDGDIAIHSDGDLLAYFEQEEQPGALIVAQANGADDIWAAPQSMNLTYCVSTSFGANYNAVVQAMQAAGDEWARAGAVKFVRVASEDANCTASNTNVVFDVRPTSGAPYLARAFFPSYPRADRNVLIDSSSFGALGSWTLTGILRHELGHTIGFRHEHIRPESGNTSASCTDGFANSNTTWRALTPYDAASVMHYPQCNGANAGDLQLTAKDRDGVASRYLPPNGTSWGWGQVSRVKLGGSDNVIAAAAGSSVAITMDYSINAGLGGCPGCISQIVIGTEGAKQCIYSGGGVVSSSASFTLTAPSTPGSYMVWAQPSWQWNCTDALNAATTGVAIGVLEVYADPYSWGWGSVSGVTVNGKSNKRVRVAPGASVPITENYSINAGLGGCPGCISQIVTGIADGSKQCAYNGGGVVSGNASLSLTAPAQKGIYKVWSRPSWEWSCTDAVNKAFDGTAVSYVEVDTCSHDKCATGGALVSGCDQQCVVDICAVDSYCCTYGWDSICVGEVNSVCHQGC